MVTDRPRAITAPPGTVATFDVHSDAALPAIWRALEAVPDPEVPVVSVIGLGMVRAIERDDADPGTIIVRMTPTYSGCPATDLIKTLVVDAVHALGVASVRVEMQLTPAWTTDWITPDAKRKLQDFGIAPPGPRSSTAVVDASAIPLRRRVVETVCCPRCGSAATERIAQFGSTACKAHYRCRDCAEPFDYFKPY